jgi:hypothetical protein
VEVIADGKDGLAGPGGRHGERLKTNPRLLHCT